MICANSQSIAWRYQSGLNLIEIMVSMAIGLFLVLGATTLYVNSKKSADVDDAAARIQESARFALSVIESDVRMANYFGLVKDGTAISNRPLNGAAGVAAVALTSSTDANDCGAGYAQAVDSPAQGNNNSFPATFIGKCAANTTASTWGSDTLTIRRVQTNTDTASNTRLQVCSNRQSGTIIMSAAATCDGEIHDLMTDIFYIDQSSNQSSTLPSLRRKSLINGPSFDDNEIVPGVEDMQVQFGWSNNITSASAVSYLEPGTTISGGQVVSVRVWLLMRSDNPDYSYTDTNTYQYANRSTTNCTVTAASAMATADCAYQPKDNYHRLLVSRTFFIRNAAGTT